MPMPSWTTVTDPVAEAALLPAWFAQRMLGARQGNFGLMLSTGDVLRVAALRAVHLGPDGTVLLDLRLHHAGVPEGVDLAWQSRHYLGAPLPEAAEATVNMAQVICAVAFTRTAEAAGSPEAMASDAAVTATVSEIREAAETAAERQTID